MFWSSYPTVAVPNTLEEYDYIIVGGGTAGCVIANRLSQDPSVTVLVVERGGVKGGFLANVPLLSSHFASDGSRSRVLQSTPQKQLADRSIDLVSSNSLGGASKINGMLYNRGIPAEYNAWSEAGRVGWAYKDLMPYFARSETDLDQHPANPKPYHGLSGEWTNRSHKTWYWSNTDRLIEANDALGVPYVEDLNDPSGPAYGCVKMHYNLDASGRRSSSLTAFLPAHLVASRKNLHICTPATVQRIQVSSKGDEAIAEGVWIQADSGGSSRLVHAKREVILTAGPIFSPQMLMLSGVGPAEHLKEHEVPVRKDLPGVGSNLQDHIAVPLQFRVPMRDSITQLMHRPWLFIVIFLQYLLFGTGILLSPVLELSIFIQSRLFDDKFRVAMKTKEDRDAALPKNLPDIEIMPIVSGDIKKVIDGGLSFFSVTLRPTSKGTVRLASTDPRADPIVDPNYFATENDWKVMRSAIRYTYQLKNELVAKGYEISEGDVPAGHTDADIDAFIKTEAQSTNHYSSTCRMAPESEGGVVDDRLRVHGVRRLRVADSSILPEIIGAHLVAITVAIGEKCAQMVKEDRKASL